MSVVELFAKPLQKVLTYILVNDNLWGKLVSSSPTMFNDNFKTTPVSFLLQTLIY